MIMCGKALDPSALWRSTIELPHAKKRCGASGLSFIIDCRGSGTASSVQRSQPELSVPRKLALNTRIRAVGSGDGQTWGPVLCRAVQQGAGRHFRGGVQASDSAKHLKALLNKVQSLAGHMEQLHSKEVSASSCAVWKHRQGVRVVLEDALQGGLQSWRWGTPSPRLVAKQ